MSGPGTLEHSLAHLSARLPQSANAHDCAIIAYECFLALVMSCSPEGEVVSHGRGRHYEEQQNAMTDISKSNAKMQPATGDSFRLSEDSFRLSEEANLPVRR